MSGHTGPTSWRVRLTPDDVPTATFTALRLAPRSRDGLAWVITDLPEPDDWPGWQVVEHPLLGTFLINPAAFEADARRQDSLESLLLAQHRRPTGQADR